MTWTTLCRTCQRKKPPRAKCLLEPRGPTIVGPQRNNLKKGNSKVGGKCQFGTFSGWVKQEKRSRIPQKLPSVCDKHHHRISTSALRTWLRGHQIISLSSLTKGQAWVLREISLECEEVNQTMLSCRKCAGFTHNARGLANLLPRRGKATKKIWNHPPLRKGPYR